MAQNEWNRQKIENEIEPAIRASGRAVRLANTEFFTNQYNDKAHAQGLFGALYAADSLILAMNKRLLACVEFCFSHGNNADAAFFYDDDPARPTPIYALHSLLARHWGDTIVKATAQGLPSRHVACSSGAIDVPSLAMSAATSANGSRLYLLVLNRTNETDVAARIDVGFAPSSVTAYTLGGPEGWDSTAAGVTTSADVGLDAHVFPRATVTLLEIVR